MRAFRLGRAIVAGTLDRRGLRPSSSDVNRDFWPSPEEALARHFGRAALAGVGYNR